MELMFSSDYIKQLKLYTKAHGNLYVYKIYKLPLSPWHAYWFHYFLMLNDQILQNLASYFKKVGRICSRFSVIFSVLVRYPADIILVQRRQQKRQNNVWNLFKVKNKGVTYGVLLSLLSTLNWFHPFIWYFNCWLWTSKGQLRLRFHKYDIT